MYTNCLVVFLVISFFVRHRIECFELFSKMIELRHCVYCMYLCRIVMNMGRKWLSVQPFTVLHFMVFAFIVFPLFSNIECATINIVYQLNFSSPDFFALNTKRQKNQSLMLQLRVTNILFKQLVLNVDSNVYCEAYYFVKVSNHKQKESIS